MTLAVLILAAGRGERLGHRLPKAFVTLGGQTLLERSLCALEAVDDVAVIQPVIGAHDFDTYAGLGLAASEKRRDPVAGGAERQDSVSAGLAALPATVEWVAVHDAARCLVTALDVGRVIEAAYREGAALLATPARDTIKRVVDGHVAHTPNRSECWAAQTPQVFRRELLTEALEKARTEAFIGTDDAQLVERMGVSVAVVEGSARNIKITLPEDLLAAEGWIAEGEIA